MCLLADVASDSDAFAFLLKYASSQPSAWTSVMKAIEFREIDSEAELAVNCTLRNFGSLDRPNQAAFMSCILVWVRSYPSLPWLLDAAQRLCSALGPTSGESQILLGLLSGESHFSSEYLLVALRRLVPRVSIQLDQPKEERSATTGPSSVDELEAFFQDDVVKLSEVDQEARESDHFGNLSYFDQRVILASHSVALEVKPRRVRRSVDCTVPHSGAIFQSVFSLSAFRAVFG
jgi:hypothetical protein